MLFGAKSARLVFGGVLVTLARALITPLNSANADTQSCPHQMAGVVIDGNLVADAPGNEVGL